MKLNEIKINAVELLSFANKHIAFEDVESDEKGLVVKMLYKFQMSDLTGFISESAIKSDLEEPSKDYKFKISGRDLVSVIENSKRNV